DELNAGNADTIGKLWIYNVFRGGNGNGSVYGRRYAIEFGIIRLNISAGSCRGRLNVGAVEHALLLDVIARASDGHRSLGAVGAAAATDGIAAYVVLHQVHSDGIGTRGDVRKQEQHSIGVIDWSGIGVGIGLDNPFHHFLVGRPYATATAPTVAGIVNEPNPGKVVPTVDQAQSCAGV